MKDDNQLPGSYQKPVKTFGDHKKYIVCIATFPDGKRIATTSDKTIHIWRLENGTEMMKWVMKLYVFALVLLENGKQIVSAEGELPDGFNEDDYKFDPNEVLDWRLWVREVESGRVVAGPLEGHTSIAMTLDISPDGKMLASGSLDNSHFMGHQHLAEERSSCLVWLTHQLRPIFSNRPTRRCYQRRYPNMGLGPKEAPCSVQGSPRLQSSSKLRAHLDA
jgi:hypothetical protein